MPRLLYSQYPLGVTLGVPQSWPGRGGEKKNSQAPARAQTPVIQPLA